MLNFEDDPKLGDLLSGDQIERLARTLGALCQARIELHTEPQPQALPIEFNLETVAWLSGSAEPASLRAATELVSFVLYFVARYQLAANLHHDTTESSFAELQRQNEALKASEARYRALSDSLQETVNQQVHTIQQAQQELYENARTRSIGHLAAGVAHEINNPIGFIKSNLQVAGDYLEELAEKLPEDDATLELLADFRDLLKESTDGSRRIASIVTDLKTFSSIDHAEYTLCNINELLEAASHLLQTSHTESRLTIDTRYGQVPDIYGNPARLSEAFYNLLDNAARAIGSDGRVIIKTLVHDDSVGIIIQDNGCGIAESAQGHVFDPFFTTRPVGSGTGLGLTVVRDTVRAHKGRIKLKSRQEAGTRVTILLPTRPPSSAQS